MATQLAVGEQKGGRAAGTGQGQASAKFTSMDDNHSTSSHIASDSDACTGAGADEHPRTSLPVTCKPSQGGRDGDWRAICSMGMASLKPAQALSTQAYPGASLRGSEALTAAAAQRRGKREEGSRWHAPKHIRGPDCSEVIGHVRPRRRALVWEVPGYAGCMRTHGCCGCRRIGFLPMGIAPPAFDLVVNSTSRWPRSMHTGYCSEHAQPADGGRTHDDKLIVEIGNKSWEQVGKG